MYVAFLYSFINSFALLLFTTDIFFHIFNWITDSDTTAYEYPLYEWNYLCVSWFLLSSEMQLCSLHTLFALFKSMSEKTQGTIKNAQSRKIDNIWVGKL